MQRHTFIYNMDYNYIEAGSGLSRHIGHVKISRCTVIGWSHWGATSTLKLVYIYHCSTLKLTKQQETGPA
jgi:hypothetical protein